MTGAGAVGAQAAAPCSRPPPLEEKLAFLRSRLAREGAPPCELRETHASWVLLSRDLALKFKKPVRNALFDFSSVAARERNAREELRLNRRLAPQVYRGLLALQWDGRGLGLMPEGEQPGARGETIDWLVLMQRLPEQLMLDHLLRHGLVTGAHVEALLGLLLPFYRAAPAAAPDEAAAYMDLHAVELQRHRQVLCLARFGLDEAAGLLERMTVALRSHEALLRLRARHLVEGHGDLRPEHVCFLDPPVVIDALEFNRRLRQVDPIDELAFLGLECAVAGASWIGPCLFDGLREGLADAWPGVLPCLYTAGRALLRARQMATHLLDPLPRTPERWLPRARLYLAHARAALDTIDGGGLTAANPRGSS